MNTSKKRKRKGNVKIPNEIIHNQSLELVASIIGPIKTIAVTTVDKEILLDRLKIELLDKYHFFLKTANSTASSPSSPSSPSPTYPTEAEIKSDTLTVEERQSIFLRRHLIVGTNECTRALEKAIRGGFDGTDDGRIPSLVMLSRDLRPPTILAHFPYLCRQLDIPIVLLPGKASSDVGRVLKRKVASVVVFMKCKMHTQKKDGSKAEKEICRRMNSYIDFAISKIPLNESTP